DPKKTGSLYGVKNIIALVDGQKEPKGDNDVREKAPSTDGEWFDYHIKVEGQRIGIKVNGEVTVDYTQPEVGPETTTKFQGRQLSEGTFGIQAHDPDSEVHYEHFKVKVLD
ncbi:MAG: family 16 glycoside hydrolase, partial [Verrucomicrobiota bacterium]